MAATTIKNRADPGTAAKADSATGWSGPNSAVRRSWRRPEGWTVTALAEPEGPIQQTTLLLHGWLEVTGLTVRATPFACHRRSVDWTRRQGDPGLGTVVSWTTPLVLGAMTGLLHTAILTL
jgi:hypothetical protein